MGPWQRVSTMTERSEKPTATAAVLIPKATHRRLKKWSKDRGLKLGFVAEKAIEQFTAEAVGGGQ